MLQYVKNSTSDFSVCEIWAHEMAKLADDCDIIIGYGPIYYAPMIQNLIAFHERWISCKAI